MQVIPKAYKQSIYAWSKSRKNAKLSGNHFKTNNEADIFCLYKADCFKNENNSILLQFLELLHILEYYKTQL